MLLLIREFDPMQTAWMPKCVLKALTGYDCPSCGATRSVHALMHGEILKALRFNYFAVVGIIYIFLVTLASRFSKNLRRIVLGKIASTVYIVLFFSWWILRNLLGI